MFTYLIIAAIATVAVVIVIAVVQAVISWNSQDEMEAILYEESEMYRNLIAMKAQQNVTGSYYTSR